MFDHLVEIDLLMSSLLIKINKELIKSRLTFHWINNYVWFKNGLLRNGFLRNGLLRNRTLKNGLLKRLIRLSE